MNSITAFVFDLWGSEVALYNVYVVQFFTIILIVSGAVLKSKRSVQNLVKAIHAIQYSL